MSTIRQETWHFWVSGQVQGVCYRASTQYEARQLGLQGWVRNLADGRVELLATGSVESLQCLQDWLEQGPELARVDSVRMMVENLTECDGFQIL